MRSYVRAWPDRSWAVEGANGAGRSLAQRLLEAGEHVVDVPAKLAARVRLFDTGHNRQTDAHDAHSIAVVALRTKTLRVLQVHGELQALMDLHGVGRWLLDPCGQDRGLHRRSRTVRVRPGARRPLDQPRFALSVDPGLPPVCALTGDPHRLRGVSNSPASSADPVHQQTTTVDIQTGISVGHENPRAARTSTIHTSPEVLLPVNAPVSPTSWPSTGRPCLTADYIR